MIVSFPTAAIDRVVAGGARDREHEIRCVQIFDMEFLEQDGSAAMRGEIDGYPVLVGSDGQVGEARYGRKLREIDEVFTIGEAADDVVSVALAEHEGIGAVAAGERFVLIRTDVQVIIGHTDNLPSRAVWHRTHAARDFLNSPLDRCDHVTQLYKRHKDMTT